MGLKSTRGRVSDVDVAVDGTPLPYAAFEALQEELTAFHAPPLSDACAVVLRNATPGEHTVAVTVRPRSFDDPQMHVAIAQLMVV